jgi:hypothetical protein
MYHRYYLKKKPRKTPVFKPTDREFSFLKNWRVVRYYIQKRYNLTLSELDMLLHLYDEHLFDRDTFNDFAKTMSWDNARFKKLMDRGLIHQWRDGKSSQYRKLYSLTQKSKLICSHTYKKLLGLELISEDPYRNKIMKGSTGTDKIYKSLIRKMNAKTTESSHNDEEPL